MEKLLSVHNVSKAYPGEKLGAVNALSFDMRPAEVLAVVGASGSGKSTLLRMLAGLLRPDQGEIIFQGQQLTNPDEQLIAGNPAIKMVFQDFELMPNMTVAENLKYPLLAYQKEYIASRVSELLNLCNIEDLAEKLPRELSGGQQQRVALARALADEPELLLMDEPFSQLDPVNKSQLLREVIRIIQESGVGLVFVTHDTRDALMIADRIAFLESGHLLQIDKPLEVYHRPTNLQVAQFFGPVNVFGLEEVREYFPELEEELIISKARSVGIRAEGFGLEEGKGLVQVDLNVSETFFLGDHYLLECVLAGGKSVVVKLESLPVGLKKEISLSFSLDNLLYFYASSVA